MNQSPARIAMIESQGEGPELSRFAGRLVLFFAMLLASVEAANRLGFDQVSELVTVFTHFGGQVLLGSVIIAVGVANIVRFAVLGLGGRDAAGVLADSWARRMKLPGSGE